VDLNNFHICRPHSTVGHTGPAIHTAAFAISVTPREKGCVEKFLSEWLFTDFIAIAVTRQLVHLK